MARKYFVDEKNIKDDKIYINNDEAKHIIKVMRKKEGDTININNYLVRITKIDRVNNVIESLIIDNQKEIKDKLKYTVKISIYQAIPKSDKMEYIIQKATEIGAEEIIPFESKNTIVKIDKNKEANKLERWNKIAKEASKQSGRNNILLVKGVYNINKICDEIKQYDIVFFAYENSENKLKDIISDYKDKNISNIAFIIGAEGGFKTEEAELLIESGSIDISLGKNILRTETATINLLSILNYTFNL